MIALKLGIWSSRPKIGFVGTLDCAVTEGMGMKRTDSVAALPDFEGRIVSISLTSIS
jgi:hypothetical protein